MADESLFALVLAQARATPAAVAVRQWDRAESYASLLGRAGALAATLPAGGTGLIGVCTERSVEMVVAVLGVLGSGAGYLPLDPAHPRDRLRHLLTESRVDAIVVDAAGRAALGPVDVPLVEVPATPLPLAVVPAGPPGRDRLAYVAYTSGSTGTPKGVLVSQRSVLEFVDACRALTGATAADRLLGLTSLSWDASVMDLFLTLTTGATVALVGHRDRIDPARLVAFAAAHETTWCVCTPPVLALLDPVALPTLRTIVVGGEALPPRLVQRWRDRHLFNVYGPTETTVFVLAADLHGAPDGEPPIGAPVGAHAAYLVDEALRPVPDGELGELLIGGPGVAYGYLDAPRLTAARFVPDALSGRPGERLYRTGDLARRRPDGQLEFLGRRDGQVKIRGQRVETGEIEAVLQAHPDVTQAAVLALPGPIGPELVAYLAPATAPADDELVAHAARRLTDAMVPRRYVRLDSLPFTVVGKVDRDALAALAPLGPGPTPTDPVAAAWSRVLGGSPGPDDDFFAHGGHSLAAMRLVAELRDLFARDVTVEDVFTGRTPAGIAARVAAAGPLTGPEPTTGNPPTLSPSQRRLWFVDQLAPDSAAYNIAFAERIRGPLDVPALAAALRRVADRHDVLCWRIEQHDGVPRPVCDPSGDVPLPVTDVTEADLAAALRDRAGTVVDLAAGPAWRAELLRLGPTEHVLCLVLHHAVADGWSQSVLYREIAAGYAGAEVPPLPASYADYAAWRADRDAERGKADLAWWTEHLAGAPTALDLPRDRPRPPVQTYAGAVLAAPLPPAADADVRAAAARHGATPSVVVLAAIGVALGRLTGRTDHVVGAVVADRRRTAFTDLVGFFVDIVPLRLRGDTGGSFADDIRYCLGEVLAAEAHPGAPLEEIVAALGVAREASRAPLVQVLFNVFNFAEPRLELPGLDVTRVPLPVPGSPFDLTLYLTERDGRFVLEAAYNTDLYRPERMRALLDGLVQLIGVLAAAPEAATAAAGPRFDTTGVTDAPAAAPARTGGSVAPATDTERLVAEVWQALLDRAELGATDNFFELGATSMAMVEASSRIAERIGRPVPVVDLFRFPNIRALAEHLDGSADTSALTRARQRSALRRRNTARRPNPR
ncbi:non-ribosomal peptide synthetase [Actinocatenispora comari]|uniref:Carrier domain-containing protein n=1 Tax=Actinocatenispora comari TaxID=2807577 RepID=A0A8J4A7P2_9ACTN|nr:non-ribosomal peptide synthetase [Actinocatenispora comari]GIL24845.1 hypothetical protein NUM_01000 [Actinocatenispora comari]